jgi:YVTN family beta-propeller protein
MASGEGSEGIALARDNQEVWVTNREDGTVTVFDTDSLEKLAEIAVPGFPIRAETDEPRGVVYVTQPAEDAMSAIDVATRKVRQRIDFEIEPDATRKTLFTDRLPGSSIPIGVLLSGDGETLFVAHSSAHLVSVWDARTLALKGTIATGLEPDGMDWSPLDTREQTAAD